MVIKSSRMRWSGKVTRMEKLIKNSEKLKKKLIERFRNEEITVNES
jgi:hypothetical protein